MLKFLLLLLKTGSDVLKNATIKWMYHSMLFYVWVLAVCKNATLLSLGLVSSYCAKCHFEPYQSKTNLLTAGQLNNEREAIRSIPTSNPLGLARQRWDN